MADAPSLALFASKLEPLEALGEPPVVFQQNHPISKASGCPCTRRRVWLCRAAPRVDSAHSFVRPPYWPPWPRWRGPCRDRGRKCAAGHQSSAMFHPRLPMGRKGGAFNAACCRWNPRNDDDQLDYDRGALLAPARRPSTRNLKGASGGATARAVVAMLWRRPGGNPNKRIVVLRRAAPRRKDRSSARVQCCTWALCARSRVLEADEWATEDG